MANGSEHQFGTFSVMQMLLHSYKCNREKKNPGSPFGISPLENWNRKHD